MSPRSVFQAFLKRCGHSMHIDFAFRWKNGERPSNDLSVRDPRPLVVLLPSNDNVDLVYFRLARGVYIGLADISLSSTCHFMVFLGLDRNISFASSFRRLEIDNATRSIAILFITGMNVLYFVYNNDGSLYFIYNSN